MDMIAVSGKTPKTSIVACVIDTTVLATYIGNSAPGRCASNRPYGMDVCEAGLGLARHVFDAVFQLWGLVGPLKLPSFARAQGFLVGPPVSWLAAETGAPPR